MPINIAGMKAVINASLNVWGRQTNAVLDKLASEAVTTANVTDLITVAEASVLDAAKDYTDARVTQVVANPIDAATADNAENGPLTSAFLSTTYARAGQLAAAVGEYLGTWGTDTRTAADVLYDRDVSPLRPTLAALGNSIIALGDGVGEDYSDTIQNMVSAYSGLEIVRNAGVAGEDSGDILDRFDSDITPYAPGVVLIFARTNDRPHGMSLADSKQNHIDLIIKCREIGAVPIMMTTLPVDSAGDAEQLENQQFDNWLRAYTADRGIVCVDVWAAVVSTAGNVWPSGDWTNDGGTGLADGIHPLPLASKAIAQAIVAAIPSHWHAARRLAVSADDPDNFVSNALMLADTNTDGIADGWEEFGGPTAASRVFTLVAGQRGKMQRITIDESGAKTAQLKFEVPTTSPAFYTAGDVLAAYVQVTLTDTALAAGKNLRLQLQVVEGGVPAWEDHLASLTVGVYPGRTSGVVDHVNAILSQRFVARSGIFATSIRMVLTSGTFAGATGGKGYAQFGRVRLVNLTRMGAVL